MLERPASPSRRLRPETVYLILGGSYALFFNTVLTVALVFQTQEAGLNPFKLVLVGTVLEATRFLCELPTGIVADLVSRKRSVLIGMVLVGGGLMLGGASTHFGIILVSQVVWGFGFTFISGAKEAWIADEVGADSVGPVYLRSAQIEQICRIIAIPIAIGLATIELRLPILLGGAMFFPLSLFLWWAMTEAGFTPRPRETRTALGSVGATFGAGGRLVRGSPLLMTIFAIAAFYGVASEGSERLWVAHFLTDLGFPSMGNLEPVVWIGVIRAGTAVFGVATVEVVRRRFDTKSHAAVSRGLFIIYALQLATFLVFATANGFVAGMLAFWALVSLSRAYTPLYLAWINQNVDSSVRATVLSMGSQAGSLGEIIGGPFLGAIGSLMSVRAALVGAAVVMAPGLALYPRARSQGGPETPAPAAAAEVAG